MTLTKRGGGALYWSAAARYFDTRTPIERTGGRRLAIAREYFTLTSARVQNRIVYRETPFSGTAAPGDVVLVRLTVAGAEDWRYLLIEDPLPAGAETIADDSLYPLEKRRLAAVGRTPGVPRRPRRLLPGRPARRTRRVLVPAEDRHARHVPRDAGAGHADVRARTCRPRRRRSPSRSRRRPPEGPVIRRLAIIAAWLLVGHAVWLAIFWGLLQVPESSVWMLALSAVLALTLVVVGGRGAGRRLGGVGSGAPAGGGAAAAASVTCRPRWLPMLLFGAIWWLTGAVFDWHTGIAGQIDAWVIARTGRTDTALDSLRDLLADDVRALVDRADAAVVAAGAL